MEIDPLTTSIVLQVGAWVWKEFGKELISKGLKAGWNRFKWPEAKQKYQQEIIKQYSKMRVLDKTLPIKDHYVELFVLEEPEAYRRYGIDHLESIFDDATGFYNRGSRSDALIVANEHDRLFVLGKPGAGKTTFLKYLAVLSAEEKIDKVPIFVSFNSWGYSQKSLLEFIVQQFDVCGFPDAGEFIELLLEKGKALVLFDGLDEVSEEGNQRGQMIYELENLIQHYQNNKFIITCRNAASDYKFERSTFNTHVEIADLSNYQISIFVKNWFGDNSSKSAKFINEIEKNEHQSLRELSHNPLLLGMLCLVFEDTSQFPPKRGMVYREAIDVLIKRWDKERGIRRDRIPGFSPSNEKKLLSFLGYEYLLENKIFFEQHDIEKKIEANSSINFSASIEKEDILNIIEVQHGLLAQRARRVYSFSHLTFQEYFAAQHIVDEINSTKKVSFDALFDRLSNPRWTEVFPLVASLIFTPDSFFKQFIFLIQKPIRRNKALVKIVNQIDNFAGEIQGNDEMIIARMRAIALVVSIGRMVRIVQNSTKKRTLQMGKELLKFLNLEESILSSVKAAEVAEIVCTKPNEGTYKEKIKKTFILAARHSNEESLDVIDLERFQKYNLDIIRVRLREQLWEIDKELTYESKQSIRQTLEKNLVRDIAIKIALDFRPWLINRFISKVEEFDFPKTFASDEEWLIYKKILIQTIAPEFTEVILALKDEHIPLLEQFLSRSIFLLDCLQQADKLDLLEYAFTITISK